MIVTRRSHWSGRVSSREIDITQADLDRVTLRGRTPIQNIVPHLSADDREFLMTGVTPEEWHMIAPKEDE